MAAIMPTPTKLSEPSRMKTPAVTKLPPENSRSKKTIITTRMMTIWISA